MWINIKNKLPDNRTIVLIYTNEGITSAQYFNEDDKSNLYFYNKGFNILKFDMHGCGCCGGDEPIITHWCPLPLPPKD